MGEKDITPRIETNIKSKADFNFSKDDILLVLLEKKESELYQQLDALKLELKESQNNLKNYRENFKENLSKELEKVLKLEDLKIGMISFHSVIINKKDLLEAKFVDINKVSQLSNVKLGVRKHTFPKCEYIYEINLKGTLPIEFKFEKEILGEKTNFYTTKQISFSNPLPKSYEEKVVKKALPLLENYIKNLNLLNQQNFDLEKEINDLEVQLLLLDSDKTIKASLYKQILAQNPELKKLIF